MKKILLSLVGILCTMSLWAQEYENAHFSAVPGASNQTTATPWLKDTETKITSATITGGSMVHYISATDTKNRTIIGTQNKLQVFGLETNYQNYKITLSGGETIKTGDKISIQIYDNKENATRGVGITKDPTTAVGANIAVTYTNTNPSTASKTLKDSYYIVKETDEIVGKSTIYLSRFTANSTYFGTITIQHEKEVAATAAPSFSGEFVTAYNAVAGVPTALNGAATQGKTYQWHQLSTSDESVTDGNKIIGATNAIYEFNPAEAGTYYFKVVASNDYNTSSSTVSPLITVTAEVSNDATVKTVSVVANGLYTATVAGTDCSVTYGGICTPRVTITPNHVLATVSCNGTNGSAGQAITVDAANGDQFTITAGDGTTQKTYTLNLTQIENKNTNKNYYAFAANDQVRGGQTFTVPGCTMTLSPAANGAFTTAGKDDYVKDGDSRFIASTGGNGQNGSFSGNAANGGTYYRLTPAENGIIDFALVLNKDKTLYVFDGTKQLTSSDITLRYSNGDKKFDDALKATEKIYGVVRFVVEGGKTYDLLTTGSKLGCYGFAYYKTPAVQLNAAGYATFSCDYSCELTGATAYAGNVNNETKQLTLTPVNNENVVPAGTGVILCGEPNATVTVAAHERVALDGANELSGTTNSNGTIAAVPGSGFTFVLNGDVLMKYSGATFAPNKAFINLATDPTAAGAKGLRMVFAGETNGIANVTSDKTSNKAVKHIVNGQLVIEKAGKMYNAAGAEIK